MAEMGEFNPELFMKYKYSTSSPGELFQIKNLRAMRGQRLDSTKSCTPQMG